MSDEIREVYNFLDKNTSKYKKELLKRIIKKFKLTRKEAEKVYEDWKKRYMTAKGTSKEQ